MLWKPWQSTPNRPSNQFRNGSTGSRRRSHRQRSSGSSPARKQTRQLVIPRHVVRPDRCKAGPMLRRREIRLDGFVRPANNEAHELLIQNSADTQLCIDGSRHAAADSVRMLSVLRFTRPEQGGGRRTVMPSLHGRGNNTPPLLLPQQPASGPPVLRKM